MPLVLGTPFAGCMLGEMGVRGGLTLLDSLSEAGELPEEGVEGRTMGSVMAI